MKEVKEDLSREKSKESDDGERILRLAEAWSEEELNQHFSETIQETPGFDPEKELEEIKNQVRRAPVHEQQRLKRDSVKEFKKKFIDQRQGLAELIVGLEETICSNPDAGKDNLLKLISEKAPVYQLNQKQIERFQKAIDIYCQKHQAIQKYVKYYQEKYPENWKEEFFRNLYGQYPVGQIDLKIGPITICWFYANSEDGGVILGIPKKAAAHFYGGKGHKKVNLAGLEDTISALNLPKAMVKGFVRGEDEVQMVRRHEEFHSINDLFFFNFLSESRKTIENLKEKYFRKDIKENEVLKLIEKFISRSVREARKLFEGLVKSEILARLKAGEEEAKEVLNFGEIEKRLLKYPSYRFFEKGLFASNNKRMNLKKFLTVELANEFGPVYEGIAPDFIRKIIQEEEDFYEHSVIDGLFALRHLAKIHPYDYDRDKLIALLSFEPLAKWPRLAKMFKEIENK